MALPTQVDGFIVTAAVWNDVINTINRRGFLEQEVVALDANGSIALTTGEETHIELNIGSVVDINGCSVPDRTPWRIYVVNTNPNTVTLKHEDATEPTPAKRFLLPNSADFSMPIGQGILLEAVDAPIGARWCAR